MYCKPALPRRRPCAVARAATPPTCLRRHGHGDAGRTAVEAFIHAGYHDRHGPARPGCAALPRPCVANWPEPGCASTEHLAVRLNGLLGALPDGSFAKHLRSLVAAPRHTVSMDKRA